MSHSGNIFADLPLNTEAEHFTKLLQLPGTRIERIVSTGQVTPPGEWYDQDWTEWVLVLQGRAHIQFENEAQPRSLSPGDWLEIAAGARHRVIFTDTENPTIWLAIHIGKSGDGLVSASP